MEPLMADTPEKQKRVADGKGRSDIIRANLASGDPEKAAREWLATWGGSWEKIPARAKQNILDNIGTLTDVGERGKFTCSDIQKFNFPILLLNGDKSPKFYAEFIAAMRQCNPNIAAPIIVPNAGHSMHRENPEFFNKAVLDFIKQH
jgi:pimeloyl-ACP methyl ester carboxylesterase